MIINHNLQSMNAHRQMGINQGVNAKSMEKLSSGMRINRAGDDAAGLSISEKMRAQVNGLNQASRNSQDGISMIQTAEGALDETHSILQRMRELSVQASTDTNDEQDRASIQDELNALTEEIDRISNTTEFNGRSLLDDSETVTLQVGANAGQHIDVDLQEMSATELLGTGKFSSLSIIKQSLFGTGKQFTATQIAVLEKEFGADLSKVPAGTALTAGHVTILTDAGAKGGVFGGVESSIKVNTADVKTNGALTDEHKAILLALAGGKSLPASVSGTTLNKNQADQLKAADGTTVKAVAPKKVDVSDLSSANGSIDTIDGAIKQVSEFRSKLGAVQNRLEHTIKNLDNAAENTQAAESRIRDVDMAEEMMEFTKTNVLSQASQSMLAQANQKPNQVLQLLG